MAAGAFVRARNYGREVPDGSNLDQQVFVVLGLLSSQNYGREGSDGSNLDQECLGEHSRQEQINHGKGKSTECHILTKRSTLS